MAIEGTQARELPEARMSAKKAGYMELHGATKDGDCAKVDVPGGVSLDRGCCNLFHPEDRDTETFSCGTCSYQRPK